jgi:hypothetical protein
MSINIENLSTEVIPEPEGSAGAAPTQTSSCEEAMKVRECNARLRRDHCRTAAEGFDD